MSQITVSVMFPCGVQFWIIDGDDPAVQEQYAQSLAYNAGGQVQSVAPTTNADHKAHDDDRRSHAYRSSYTWESFTVPRNWSEA
jgi:hypothetical protein